MILNRDTGKVHVFGSNEYGQLGVDLKTNLTRGTKNKLSSDLDNSEKAVVGYIEKKVPINKLNGLVRLEKNTEEPRKITLSEKFTPKNKKSRPPLN
jgi:hypothetical protein